MAWIAGVDGCRAGWFRVCRETTTGELRFDLIATAADLLVTPPMPEILAIDMPIGLSDAGPRRCDREARLRLGPRRASVFSPPIRPVLEAASREAASDVMQRIDGRRLSVQAWGIVPRIRELDAALHEDARLRAAAREVHPELSFRAWNEDTPMAHAKRSAGGLAERRALAERWLGDGLLERARGDHPRGALADDDVLDAVATLWTAHRIRHGDAVRLPDPAPRDAAGLAMEIVY